MPGRQRQARCGKEVSAYSLSCQPSAKSPKFPSKLNIIEDRWHAPQLESCAGRVNLRRTGSVKPRQKRAGTVPRGGELVRGCAGIGDQCEVCCSSCCVAILDSSVRQMPSAHMKSFFGHVGLPPGNRTTTAKKCSPRAGHCRESRKRTVGARLNLTLDSFPNGMAGNGRKKSCLWLVQAGESLELSSHRARQGKRRWCTISAESITG